MVGQEDMVYEVEEVPHVWVLGKDGCRLAARMWLPARRGGGRQNRSPVAVEILPYRKSDGTAEVDSLVYPYLAGHGVACLRVDSRGCGDSDGIFDDEYSELQQADAMAVIDWAATQSWSSGQVLMMGCSWGGFTALQAATIGHPSLIGAVAVCATDQRFEDDMHYQGGCLLGENLNWGSWLMHTVSQPPDPQSVGEENWRSQWLSRLSTLEPLAAKWMRHSSQKDPYWDVGSCGTETVKNIRVPLLLVGGSKAGGYANSIPRLAANAVNSKVTTLMGPWSHNYPHISPNGPQVGFLQLLLRWLADLLPSSAVAVPPSEDAPTLPGHTVFAAHAHSKPSSQPEAFEPGEWLATGSIEEAAALAPEQTLQLRAGGLLLADDAPPGGHGLPKSTIQILPGSCREAANALISGDDSGKAIPAGMEAGSWFTFGNGPDLPGDQAPDDTRSAIFDTQPMEDGMLLLGTPSCKFQFEGCPAAGMVAVRLCCVAPSGTSTRLSYGLLNLSGTSASQGNPVTVQLGNASWVVPAGSRLRLAVSADYWPVATVADIRGNDLAIQLAGCSLKVPLGPYNSEAVNSARNAVRLPASVHLPQPLMTTTLRSGTTRREQKVDAICRSLSQVIVDDRGCKRLESANGLEVDSAMHQTFTLKSSLAGEPVPEHHVCHRTKLVREQDNWHAEVRLSAKMVTRGGQHDIEVAC